MCFIYSKVKVIPKLCVKYSYAFFKYARATIMIFKQL